MSAVALDLMDEKAETFWQVCLLTNKLQVVSTLPGAQQVLRNFHSTGYSKYHTTGTGLLLFLKESLI